MAVAYMTNQKYVTFDNAIIVNSWRKQLERVYADAVYNKPIKAIKHKDIKIPGSFQNTSTFETRLSYFHKLVVSVLKLHPTKKLRVVS